MRYKATIKANPTLDNKYNQLKLPAVLTLLDSPEVKAHGVGYSTRQGWEVLEKTLIDLDMMKDQVNVDTVFTNQFLK